MLALFTQQRYVDAQRCADQLVRRFPQHGFTWKALGAIHKKLGDADAALAALTRATGLLPHDPDVHYNLGNSYLERQQFSEAVACYTRAVALQPGYMAAHYNLAKAWQGRHHLDEAESSYRTVLTLQPGFADAMGGLGVVLHAAGKPDDAAKWLHRAAESNPADPMHHTNLANVLHALGRDHEAELTLRRALQIDAHAWQPLTNLANILLGQKRLQEAESLYVQVLQLREQDAEVWLQLGNCLFAQNRFGEAEIAYRESLCHAADNAEAHNHLGITLRETGRLELAEQSYREALRRRPDYMEAHNNLGNVLRELDRIPEAEACFHRALAIDPDYTEAHNNLGIALKAAGRLDEARAALEQAIRLNPDFLEPHFGIATLKTYHDDDPHIEQLERQLATVFDLKPEAQIRFWFAIGKMYEDLGRFDDSFAAYDQGNRLKFSSLSWEEERESALVDAIKAQFSADFFRHHTALPADTSRTPVFILGMPRSGTSLLEQILSTHPGVFGAGELLTLNDVIVQAMPEQDYRHYPQAVAQFTSGQWQQTSTAYLRKVWELAPHASHITDKMPSNFLHIGMIRMMFPHAKIIHAMRDPMDSCFSNFSRLFNKNNIAFSYDLQALGNYYNRYIDLMEHWHAVLPPGAILDCRYEQMVDDTEAQARRVLDYLGLPWDERCLDFHKNRRRVRTASQAQVQKPIYKSSVARWKQYEKHLQPLAALIAQRGRPY